ncbi:hypothetical protein D1871_11105 [Nakamurella silvestris]|nr:hypothetical protein D1871_11105 [Nakamurella silvestris]
MSYRLFNPTDDRVVYDLAGHAVDPHSWCESDLDDQVMTLVNAEVLTIGEQVPEAVTMIEPGPPPEETTTIVVETARKPKGRNTTATPDTQEDPS